MISNKSPVGKKYAEKCLARRPHISTNMYQMPDVLSAFPSIAAIVNTKMSDGVGTSGSSSLHPLAVANTAATMNVANCSSVSGRALKKMEKARGKEFRSAGDDASSEERSRNPGYGAGGKLGAERENTASIANEW